MIPTSTSSVVLVVLVNAACPPLTVSVSQRLPQKRRDHAKKENRKKLKPREFLEGVCRDNVRKFLSSRPKFEFPSIFPSIFPPYLPPIKCAAKNGERGNSDTPRQRHLGVSD